MDQQIIIVGFMGCGKSRVARELAKLLNCVAVDLDKVIAEETGRTAKEIIEEDGEQAFREVETDTLRRTLEAESARVISLGGGAWIRQGNRELVTNHNALSVWIDTPFQICWQRIQAARNKRPLARNREQAKALFNERRPTYALAAQRVPVRGVDASSKAALAIARAVERNADLR